MDGHKNGFKILNWSDDRRLLVYMDARKLSLYDKQREEYIKFYHEENLNGLAFENQIYYPYDDLEVLKQYPFIEHLLIGQINIKDLTAIKYVNHLKGLYFEDNIAAFDFSIVKDSLENLSLIWHRNASNLDSLINLKWLYIERDQDDVLLPKGINKVQMYKSKRTTLNVFEHLINLKEVELYSNTKLTDIEGLVHLSQSLEVLEIEKCKNIADYTPILKLKTLKKLIISSYDKNRKEELKQLKKQLENDVYFNIS